MELIWDLIFPPPPPEMRCVMVLQKEYWVGPLGLLWLELSSTCGKCPLLSRSSPKAWTNEGPGSNMLVLHCLMCSLIHLALESILGGVDAHFTDKMNKEI